MRLFVGFSNTMKYRNVENYLQVGKKITSGPVMAVKVENVLFVEDVTAKS